MLLIAVIFPVLLTLTKRYLKTNFIYAGSDICVKYIRCRIQFGDHGCVILLGKQDHSFIFKNKNEMTLRYF